MVNFAKKAKCTYSRYADDLTFSTNRKEFPEKIAVKKNGNEWSSSNALKKEIERVGFAINEKKTSLQYKTARQITTGLVVNKKVNIKREYYRQTRSMCHSLFHTNQFFLGNNHIAATGTAKSENFKIGEASKPVGTIIPIGGSPPEGKENGTVKHLESVLSFIYHVKRPHDNRGIDTRRHHPNAITKLFRNFLFYKHFFFLNRPLIICEGKTDITYLKCALKQLQEKYGEFVKKTGDKFLFKIGFLNLTKNLKDVLAISEGTGGLVSLMGIYKKYMEPFKKEGKKYPVIILVDNDSGSKQMMTKLKNPDPSKQFHYFLENLYIVGISSGGGTGEMAIEDLFDKQTLNTSVAGKKFNRGPKIDSATEYGKIVFAEKVVKANQDSINFGGFKEVLNRFKAVIEDYKQKNVEKIN